MDVKVTESGRGIYLDNLSIIELTKMQREFTKRPKNAYAILERNPNADVNKSFMDVSTVPVGLWVELVETLKKYNINANFSEDFLSTVSDTTANIDEFRGYISKLFEKSEKKPKDYQVDGIFNVIKYRECCAEVSTNGGKTLMCYILFKYMMDVKGVKHILYITPSTSLTTQSSTKFEEYDGWCGIETNWTYDEIYGGVKKKPEYDADIIFGNYQSLVNMDPTFFEMFDLVIVDECHHSRADSIIAILDKCVNSKYRVGLTGTFPKDPYDKFLVESHIGPLVYTLTSDDLINVEKFSTPVYVTGIVLDYLPEEMKKRLFDDRSLKSDGSSDSGRKLLEFEKDIMRKSEDRFKYICDLAKKTTKNTLIIYTDIKTGYGRRIYNYLNDYSDKRVYYIDGKTNSKNRDIIKQQMEDDTEGKTIIVASMGCFSEGIDIANLWNIFLVETTLSEVNLAQLLGRGMRRYEGKDKTMFLDFGDDYTYGKGKRSMNYLMKHFNEREKIYKSRNFPYKKVSIYCGSNVYSLFD